MHSENKLREESLLNVLSTSAQGMYLSFNIFQFVFCFVLFCVALKRQAVMCTDVGLHDFCIGTRVCACVRARVRAHTHTHTQMYIGARASISLLSPTQIRITFNEMRGNENKNSKLKSNF